VLLGWMGWYCSSFWVDNMVCKYSWLVRLVGHRVYGWWRGVLYWVGHLLLHLVDFLSNLIVLVVSFGFNCFVGVVGFWCSLG